MYNNLNNKKMKKRISTVKAAKQFERTLQLTTIICSDESMKHLIGKAIVLQEKAQVILVNTTMYYIDNAAMFEDLNEEIEALKLEGALAMENFYIKK